MVFTLRFDFFSVEKRGKQQTCRDNQRQTTPCGCFVEATKCNRFICLAPSRSEELPEAITLGRNP